MAGSSSWGSGGAVTPHALGGISHNPDTLANLNGKISDATLIDTGDSRLSDARTPVVHALGGTRHSADTLANLNSKITDATLSDYSSFTGGSISFSNGSGLIEDNANLFWDDTLNRLGLGTNTPLAPLELVGVSPGVVGGFASGTFHVKSSSTLINANAVITGHNSFGGNKQLWYLGSSSSSNDNVIFINRQIGTISILNSISKGLIIDAAGKSTLADVEITDTLQISIGTPSVNDVWTTTDAFGNGSWQSPSGAAITGQFSDSTDQKPSVTTPVVITFNTNDLTPIGLSHSTTVDPEEFTADVAKAFTFMLAPQWERTSGGPNETMDVFIQKDTGAGFVDVPNSNIKMVTGAVESGVIPLMYTLDLAISDKVRFMQKISSTVEGMGLVSTAAGGGVPATPSVILTVFSGD